MPCFRALLLVLGLAGFAAAAELKTTKNETLKGDVVSVSKDEIVMKVDGKEVKTPIKEVMALSMAPSGELPQAKYAMVELTDGSIFYCKQVRIKKKTVEMTLLGDQKATVPITGIAYLLNDANEQANKDEWKKVLARKSITDLLVVKFEGVVNALPVAFGNGSDEGDKIDFTRQDETKQASLDRVVGLFFSQRADPMAPPVACTLLDTERNFVYASDVALNPAGFVVSTPAGGKVEYKANQVSTLDYRRGKLTYLSELEPTQVIQDSTEEVIYPWRRDANIDGGEMRIEGKKYEKGLSLHSHTELVYNLGGEYRQFKAVIGIDDQVGGSDERTILKIEGDGRELATMTITRKDKARSQVLNLNVKDIDKLRITVTSGDLLDYGKHLNLGDAQVSK